MLEEKPDGGSQYADSGTREVQSTIPVPEADPRGSWEYAKPELPVSLIWRRLIIRILQEAVGCFLTIHCCELSGFCMRSAEFSY